MGDKAETGKEKLLGDNIIYPTIKPDRLVSEEQSKPFSPVISTLVRLLTVFVICKSSVWTPGASFNYMLILGMLIFPQSCYLGFTTWGSEGCLRGELQRLSCQFCESNNKEVRGVSFFNFILVWKLKGQERGRQNLAPPPPP